MTDQFALADILAPKIDTFDASNFLTSWRSSVTSVAAQAAAHSSPQTTKSSLQTPAKIWGAAGHRGTQTTWIPAADLENRLGHRLMDLKVQTASVAMHLSADWRDALFRQLDMLLSEENWEPIDELPKLESYLTAMRLLIFLKEVARPGLGLSHDGNIILSWSHLKDHLTIECRGDDSVRWIVSHTLPDGTRERAAGDSNAKRVPAVIAAYEPEKWLGASR